MPAASPLLLPPPPELLAVVAVAPPVTGAVVSVGAAAVVLVGAEAAAVVWVGAAAAVVAVAAGVGVELSPPQPYRPTTNMATSASRPAAFLNLCISISSLGLSYTLAGSISPVPIVAECE